ncbi:MAG TPA: hypothetical protein VKQ72_04480 [Aggregatilineales bacterium]|nr:hypothetical protein [Aggregatilineales bacterium]
MLRKRVVPFRLLAAVSLLSLAFTQPSQTAAPQAKTPMLLGVNYYTPLWRDNERALLGFLPLGIVRWGGNSSDTSDNPVGLVQRFVSETRAINHAEPLYQVPFLYETPDEAAQELKSVNIDSNLGIKYWEIGNEPELFQASHHSSITVDDYVKGWRTDAQAMLAADPSITLVGPDVSLNITSDYESSRAWQWFTTFLKANGDMVKVVTLHFYPYGSEDLTPDQIFANADVFAKNIAQIQAYIHDTLKRDVPLMINEINLSYVSGGSTKANPSGLFAGLWLADIIGKAAQQGVAAVIPWTATRNGGLGILDDNGNPHPTYYAIHAFSGLGSSVDTPSGLPAGLIGYHSQGDSDEAIEVLINTTAQPISLSVGGKSITLGEYSVTRLHLDASGKLADGQSYGQKEFDAQSGPSDVVSG